MASSSSSSSSAPEKSQPQPLHNFELSSLIRWNNNKVKPIKRHRSVKSPPSRPIAVPPSPLRHPPVLTPPPPPPPPPPRQVPAAAPHRYQHPHRDFGSGPSRFQSLLRECTASPPRYEPLLVAPSLDDDLEKLSSIREETLRNYRGRNWWSETDDLQGNAKASVVRYARNPYKNSKFEVEKKSSKAAAETDHGRNSMMKSGKDAARSNLLIKIGGKNVVNADEESESESEEGDKEKTSDEEETKVWNLRPRNAVKTSTMAAAGNASSAGIAGTNKSNKGGGGGGEAKKKEKIKLGLTISLTKREIEEDIFSLTGRKPSRRPKRRTKLVQKQLDTVFPGLGLGSITPETYKVSENSRRG